MRININQLRQALLDNREHRNQEENYMNMIRAVVVPRSYIRLMWTSSAICFCIIECGIPDVLKALNKAATIPCVVFMMLQLVLGSCLLFSTIALNFLQALEMNEIYRWARRVENLAYAGTLALVITVFLGEIGFQKHMTRIEVENMVCLVLPVSAVIFVEKLFFSRILDLNCTADVEMRREISYKLYVCPFWSFVLFLVMVAGKTTGTDEYSEQAQLIWWATAVKFADTFSEFLSVVIILEKWFKLDTSWCSFAWKICAGFKFGCVSAGAVSLQLLLYGLSHLAFNLTEVMCKVH